MSKKKAPTTLGKEVIAQQLEYMHQKLKKTSSKAEKKYLKGVIAGLEGAAGVDVKEAKDDGFWYVVFDTEDVADTFDFHDTAEEAQAHINKLIIEEFRSAETLMVIKGHELPLMAGFVND